MAVDLSDYTGLIEKIAKQLYDGKITPSELSAELLLQTLDDVRAGLSEGVGKDFVNYETNGKRNLSLNQHLYRFSGAKTYQELAKINFFLKDKKSFSEFKKEALKINEEYNLRYLQTEYNTAKRSGEQATKWQKYQEQKELYPNLKYKTANDARVRESHRNQQDIIKPIDDAFWATWYPPNDFGCRCYVVQTDEKPTKGTPKENPSPGFNNNVGLSNQVFSEDEHPYFIFPAEDAKKIRESFENLKLSNPDYQKVYKGKKGTIEASTWADPNDFEKNFANAKTLVDQLGVNVKIRNHSDRDGITNPEYEIGGVKSDLKVIDSPERGIENSFKSMKAKMKNDKNDYSIVISLDNVKITFKQIEQQLINKVSKDRSKKVESVYFINDGKAVRLTRDEMVKRDFSKLKKLL